MCISVDLHKLREMRLECVHLHERLEERAKSLWRNAGCPKGRDLEFWNDAEREIIGYTKEEFRKLYGIYEQDFGFFFSAPNVLAGSEEQLEALRCWGWNPWSLWTLHNMCDFFEGDPYLPHPFLGFDFSKPRQKRVAKMFKEMEMLLIASLPRA